MQDGNIYTTLTAGADKVVSTGPAVLHRIIIGKDVASSVVEVSDSPSDGDGNVKVYLEGSTLHTTASVVEVGAVFRKGICMDLTNQTHVMVVWSPSQV